MLQVVFPNEGEVWTQFIERLQQCKKGIIVIISGSKATDLMAQDKQCQRCLQYLAQRTKKTFLVSNNTPLLLLAKARGITCISASKKLKQLLKGHAQYNEALREFVPHVWRQQLRSRLQAMGLLSLPKLRVWILLIVCIVSFLFTVFELLPSANVRLTARQDSLLQTANIFLVQSGALMELKHGEVRTIDLKPVTAKITKTITFTDISKEFSGTAANVTMKITNTSSQSYSLRPNSRLSNNAGLIFLVTDALYIAPNSTKEVQAVAADKDIYNIIIGDRGNVPANLRWDFLGLESSERVQLYAENTASGTGGSTSNRLVYTEADVKLAEKVLQQSLLSDANQQIDEEIEMLNSLQSASFNRLYYDELRSIHFSDFQLSKEYIGQEIASVPITGTIEYTAYTYDKLLILKILIDEIKSHIEQDKEIVGSSLREDLLTIHVMEYSDDLTWVKLTVDLSASEQAILDPLTPAGIAFSNKVRDLILGLSVSEAKKIISNLPEVERASIEMWPPWNRTLPDIAYNITFTLDE